MFLAAVKFKEYIARKTKSTNVVATLRTTVLEMRGKNEGK